MHVTTPCSLDCLCENQPSNYASINTLCVRPQFSLTLPLNMEASEICVICAQPIEEAPSATLIEKWCRGIDKASETRNDNICRVPGQQVRQECRRKYCHLREVSKVLNIAKQGCSTSATEGHVLRSAEKRHFQFCQSMIFMIRMQCTVGVIEKFPFRYRKTVGSVQ